MNEVITLHDELSHWDGAVESLGVLYQQRKDDEQFLSQLVLLLDELVLQLPASWLLKCGLEDGIEATAREVSKILAGASQLEHWQARLHLLQSLKYLVIPSTEAAGLHGFLTRCLKEDNKFIRAWAYQGFLTLAEQHDTYRDETHALLEKAMQEEAPAIKARLRNHLKQRDVGH